MGLAQRRAIQEFEKNDYPALKAELVEAAGYDLQFEINWEGMGSESLPTELYKSALKNIYFEPVKIAITNIAKDEFGKDALKAGLKKVSLLNSSNNFYLSWFTFEDGVLTIDHAPDVNIDDVNDKATVIQQLLELKL